VALIGITFPWHWKPWIALFLLRLLASASRSSAIGKPRRVSDLWIASLSELRGRATDGRTSFGTLSVISTEAHPSPYEFAGGAAGTGTVREAAATSWCRSVHSAAGCGLVNGARAQAGARRLLRLANVLMQVAQRACNVEAQHSTVSIPDPKDEETSPGKRLANAGYALARAYGGKPGSKVSQLGSIRS